MIMFYFFPFFVSSLFVHTPSSTKHQYPQTELNNKTNKETNKQKHVSHNLVGCKCFNAIMVTNIFFFSCYFPSFFQRYYQIVIFFFCRTFHYGSYAEHGRQRKFPLFLFFMLAFHGDFWKRKQNRLGEKK